MNTKQASTEAKTYTFDVSLPEALYLAEVGLSGASDDDVTPIITASMWTLKGDSIETLSTDRYRVHRATVDAPGVGEGLLGMPRDALTWLTKNRAYFRRGSSVTEPVVTVAVELTEGAVASTTPVLRLPSGRVTLTIVDTLDDRAISLRTNLIRGNFPPVHRLFETAYAASEPAPAVSRINLDFLSKTRALAATRREAPPKLKFTGSENPNKPGPLLVSYERGEALIQPNLLLR